MFYKYHYVLRLEFLGFRYHGWQKQLPQYKTLQGMLEKTLNHILGEGNTKNLGASRTDRMVSAHDYLCKVSSKIECSPEVLKNELNKNLPQDIRVISLEETTEEFQVIGAAKEKTYHYYFSNTQDFNPMAAPFIVNFHDKLNIELMQEAAKLFKGTHSFEKYCYKPNEHKIFEREIIDSQIIDNNILKANFFPDQSYIFEVKGPGFLRHQVRIMMGALILVGNGEMSIDTFKESLKGNDFERIPLIAPASGLRLHKTNITCE